MLLNVIYDFYHKKQNIWHKTLCLEKTGDRIGYDKKQQIMSGMQAK